MMDQWFDPYWQWLGIPREEQPPNHYRLLGLPPLEGNLQKIEQAGAARLALLEQHADGPYASAAAHILAEVAQAMACLTDPQRKAAYDASFQRFVAGWSPTEDKDVPHSSGGGPTTDPSGPTRGEFQETSFAIPRAVPPTSRVAAAAPQALSPAVQSNRRKLVLVVGATVALLLATVLLLAWELLPAGKSPSAANQRSMQSAATDRARMAPEGTVKSTSSNNAPPPAHGSAAPASTGDFSRSASQHSAGPASGLPGDAAAPSTATGPVPRAGAFGFAPAKGSSAPEAYLANLANTATQQRAVADLLAKVQQAVVLVTATLPAGTGQGSGFLVEGGNSVVTNYHVVEDATAVQVRLHDGRTAPVDRYATDAARDLAVLQILSLPDLPTGLPLRAELPKAGETVYAVGSPLGLEGSVTQGIVSAVRTCAQIEASLGSRLKYAPESRWVQTTAPVSHGNSGGPLVDTEGRALGVVTIGLRVGQNLNFALAAADVVEAMQAPKFVAVSPGNAPPIRSPVPPGRFSPPSSSGLPAFPTVSLPGGQILHASMLQVPKDLKSWLSSAEAVFRVRGPGDAVLVVAGFNDGRLHGRAAWFHLDNGRLAVLGHYDNAKRDGDFVFYWPNGSPMWLAQYKANSRHGVVAWFSGGFPVWIELWVLGNRMGEYFVSCHQAAAEVKNPDDVSDQAVIGHIRETINQVTEIVQAWEYDEAQLRRDLAEWFRQTDYAIKRHRATIRNVQARQAMLERIEARSSERTIGTMRSFAERARAAGW